MSIQKITRQDAIYQGKTTYFTNKTCKNGHIAERWVSTRQCVECSKNKLNEWRIKNKNKVNEYKRNYYKENRDKINLKKRDYNTKNKVKLNNNAKEKRKSDPEKYMLYRAKYRAKMLGIPFNISVNDIHIPNKCPVFGTDFKYGDIDYSPSLDRIVPSLGYVKGNVIVISTKANRIKNDSNIEELKMIYEFLTKQFAITNQEVLF